MKNVIKEAVEYQLVLARRGDRRFNLELLEQVDVESTTSTFRGTTGGAPNDSLRGFGPTTSWWGGTDKYGNEIRMGEGLTINGKPTQYSHEEFKALHTPEEWAEYCDWTWGKGPRPWFVPEPLRS